MKNLLVALMVVAAAPAAFAESFTEPSTEVKYETSKTVDGKKYVLVGAGVRKKFVVKVYAMGLYVDEADAKSALPSVIQRAGGSDHAHLTAGDTGQQFVVWGQFGKMATLHFVRNVDKEKIVGAFKESLADELSDKSPPDVKKATEAFLAMCDRDMKDGEEFTIRTWPDGKIWVDIAGNKKDGPQNVKLARAIWNIWLGSKPISGDLKKALVDRLDLLAK